MYNGAESGFETLEENVELDENSNVESITDNSHLVSLELPDSLEEDDSFTIQLEFRFTTTNNNIGPFTEIDVISFNVGDNWSEPHDSEPEDSELSTLLEEMDGNGSENDPYIIMDDHDLQAMNGDLESHYVLGQNIDARKTNEWNGSSGFEPIMGYEGFKGSIDGNNFEIRGLNIHRTSRLGLIGLLEGTVKNINLTDVNIGGQWNIGGIAGENRGIIENILVQGYLYQDVDYAARAHLGGISGRCRSTVKNSYSDVIMDSQTRHTGGISGTKTSGKIENSYSQGSINGTRNVGGLVGEMRSTITNCYSTVSVSGDANVGGLVGNDDGGTVENSYWDIESSNTDISDGGTGLTTDEMQGDTPLPEEDDTMSGFEFDNVWETVEGEYPVLQALDTQEQLDNRD